jgi:hypothetical protein
MQVLQSNPTKILHLNKDSTLVALLDMKTFSTCAHKPTDLSTFLSQFFSIFFYFSFLSFFLTHFFFITKHKDQIKTLAQLR